MEPSRFNRHDVHDIKELFRLYDYRKAFYAEEIVSKAEGAGKSPTQLFRELYELFHIDPLPFRESVMEQLRKAIPVATIEDVESAVREVEMKGLNEGDALRFLRRKYGVEPSAEARIRVGGSTPERTRTPTSAKRRSSRGSSPRCVVSNEAFVERKSQPPKSSTPPASIKEFLRLASDPTDDFMHEEVREWLVSFLGSDVAGDVRAQSNVVDSLRNGVVLSALSQKLNNPNIRTEALCPPKWSSKLAMRNSVEEFVREMQSMFGLMESEIFTDADLCDGKDDRKVIKCLFRISRTIFEHGLPPPPPTCIVSKARPPQKANQVLHPRSDRAEGSPSRSTARSPSHSPASLGNRGASRSPNVVRPEPQRVKSPLHLPPIVSEGRRGPGKMPSPPKKRRDKSPIHPRSRSVATSESLSMESTASTESHTSRTSFFYQKKVTARPERSHDRSVSSAGKSARPASVVWKSCSNSQDTRGGASRGSSHRWSHDAGSVEVPGGPYEGSLFSAVQLFSVSSFTSGYMVSDAPGGSQRLPYTRFVQQQMVMCDPDRRSNRRLWMTHQHPLDPIEARDVD